MLKFLLDSARAAPTHTQATHTAMVDVDQTDLWSTDDCPPASDIRRYRQDGEGTYASGRLLPYLPPFVDHTTGLPHTAGSPDPVEMQMPLSSAQYNTSTVTSDFDPEVDTMGVDTPTIAKKPLGFLMATYPQFFSPSSQQPSTLGEVDRLLGVTQELSPLLLQELPVHHHPDDVSPYQAGRPLVVFAPPFVVIQRQTGHVRVFGLGLHASAIVHFSAACTLSVGDPDSEEDVHGVLTTRIRIRSAFTTAQDSLTVLHTAAGSRS